MIRVGIRELRQSASVLIRRVIEGETIAEGRATAARGDLLEVKPIPPVAGKRPLSQLLADLRADDR